MIAVRLPWPDSVLSPNARPHWSVKARAVRAARAEAKYALLAAADGQPLFVGDGDIDIRITFCPPDNRRRDRDNVEASLSLKAYRDGLADALGVDDMRFRSRYRWLKPLRYQGADWQNGGILIVLLGVSVSS